MNGLVEIILMGIYFITPLVLGLGYYVKTRQEVLNEEDEDIKPKLKDMDDILDIDMTT